MTCGSTNGQSAVIRTTTAEEVEAFKRATFGREEKRLTEMLEDFLQEHQQTYLAAPAEAVWGNPARIWPQGTEWVEARPDAKRALKVLRAWLATQRGDFALAEQYVRRTIEEAPFTGQNWLGLSMIRKFSADDEDLRAMRRIESQMHAQPAMSRAAFYYALGKALHDAKDFDAAFVAYAKGARLRKEEERFDADGLKAFANGVIGDFSLSSMKRMKASSFRNSRAIFVTGLPRSGTTLVEQILTSHSAVADGGELNLLRAALHPAGDFSFAAAAQFERQRHVVERTQVPEQLKVLEHEADLLAAQGRAGVLVEGGQFPIREPKTPGRRQVKAGQQRQQRGLAAAGWANDGAALTGRNGEIDRL